MYLLTEWEGRTGKYHKIPKISHWAIVGRKFTSTSQYKPPRGLYLAGRFNGGFFALRVWRGLYLERLFTEFYGIWLEVRAF